MTCIQIEITLLFLLCVFLKNIAAHALSHLVLICYLLWFPTASHAPNFLLYALWGENSIPCYYIVIYYTNQRKKAPVCTAAPKVNTIAPIMIATFRPIKSDSTA